MQDRPRRPAPPNEPGAGDRDAATWGEWGIGEPPTERLPAVLAREAIRPSDESERRYWTQPVWLLSELPTRKMPAVTRVPQRRPRPDARPGAGGDPGPQSGALRPLSLDEFPTAPLVAVARSATLGRMQAQGRGRGVNARIAAAVLSIASVSMIVRLFSMASQVVISARFGAGADMDAYFAALSIPLFFTNLAVVSLDGAVIPVFSRLHEEHRDAEASVVLSTLANVLILTSGAMTLIIARFPRTALDLIAPGLSAPAMRAGMTLMPWVVPTLLLNILIGFITSVLSTTRRFAVPAMTGVFLPFATTAAALLLAALYGVTALGIGLLVGTLLQFLALVVLTRATRLQYRPVMHLRHPDVRRAMKEFVTMLAGAAIGLASPIVDQIVTSVIGTGGISVLNYAQKIINIPVSVFFVAISRAVLPYFSGQVAASDFVALKRTLHVFTWLIGLSTLGMSLALIVLARPLISLIYQHGAFTARDGQQTTAVLVGFAVGLSPMALGFLLPRVFSALRQNHVFVWAGAISVASNAGLDLLFARFLGVPGVALATSVNYVLMSLLLLFVLRRLLGPLGLLTPPPELLHIRMVARRIAAARAQVAS